MAGRLTNKVAFITGAARGQGRSHAVRLAEEGADIIAVDLCASVRNVTYRGSTPEDLAQTVKEVEALGRRIYAQQADVRDATALQEVLDEGVSQFGRLDIVIANAGVSIMRAWDEITPEIWQDTLDINLTGSWNTARAGISYFIDQGNGGSVILISSSAGLKAMPFLAHYDASKHGVTGLARALAAEWARYGVRVNTIHPCGVDTEMCVEAAFAPVANAMAENPKLAGMMINMLDVNMIQPIDVSNAVVYLASDESRYVTGLAMSVDAGCLQF